MAVTADYDAQSAIESGLFKIQAKHLLQFRQSRRAHQKRQNIIDAMNRNSAATGNEAQKDQDEHVTEGFDGGSESGVQTARHFDDVTRSFVRLTNLPTYPLDRLSRYEAALWRQSCQIMFTLHCLERRKPLR